jgi:hypothetical protein
MNLTCFYCQTPFTLSMDQKIAALRKMHAEGLHHYDAHCPRCGRANAISRERLEMFTPGWEEAIKEPAMATMQQGGSNPSNMPAAGQMPNTVVSTPVPMPEEREPGTRAAMKRSSPARKRHAPAAKKAARKGAAKKATAKKATTKKKTAVRSKKTATKKSRSKSSSRKTARKSR